MSALGCVCVCSQSLVWLEPRTTVSTLRMRHLWWTYTGLPVLIGAPLVGLCPVPCLPPLIAQTTLQALLDISA